MMTSLLRRFPLAALLLQYLLLAGLVHLIYDQLPRPSTDDDPTAFNAQRAWYPLAALTALGPRVVGSSEIDMSVRILMDTLQELKLSSLHPLTVDHTPVDGEVTLSMSCTFTTKYQQLQNVAARLTFGATPSPTAILLSCHFDSVPHSQGASDDAANCAILLDVLRVLSRTPTSTASAGQIFHHDVIFLFNGAEETGLQAAHGFITQHHWAPDVRAFINLEGAGAGGRELLFQSGPGDMWILEAYLSNAPHPSASVIAQELFQHGLVPSVTDFQIYRDYGNLSGLDIAFVRNGYVYHTNYDAIDFVTLGTLQRVGENVLAVTRGMLSLEHFPNENKKEEAPVYFELLGSWPIAYSRKMAMLVNLSVCLFALVVIYVDFGRVTKKTDAKTSSLWQGLWYYLILRASSLCLSLAFNVALGSVLGLLGRTMAWYHQPLLLLPMYAIPTTLINNCVLEYFSKKSPTLSPPLFNIVSFSEIQLEFVLLTLLGTAFGINSAYLPMLFVLFPLLGRLIVSRWSLEHQEVANLLLSLNPFLLVPILNMLYLMTLIYTFFIPIMGHSGTSMNPDIILGTVTAVFVFFVTAYTSPLVPRSQDFVRMNSILIGGWISIMLLVLLTEVGFPYSAKYKAEAPERFSALHTKRRWFDENGLVVLDDAGISLESMNFYDSSSQLEKYVLGYNERTDITKDCDTHLMCGVGFARGGVGRKRRLSWLPFAPPHFPAHLLVDLKLVEKSIGDLRRLRFNVRGPNPTAVAFALDGLQLIRWSLMNGTVPEATIWQDKSCYFVNFLKGNGGNSEGVEEFLWLDVMRTSNQPGMLEVTVSGNYRFGSNMVQENFKQLLKTFPDWAFVSAQSTDLKSYKFEV